MTRALTYVALLLLLTSCSDPQSRIITVIGTNDVHGQLLASEERGGLVTLSGYVTAARAARRQDGGAVLLIDAGDMWQGTLESNQSEGAAVVAAYNALGYTAATIGNHEFDFGPAGPAATPEQADQDARGALRQRAAEAAFPLLAANLIDTGTDQLVAWENVVPTVLVDIHGIKAGVIGVMTENALRTTIALNVGGLRVAPLAPAIEKYARKLRADGADLVVVTAHAGGRCTEFSDPDDLTSCQQNSEIFKVARALPAGLVDHIIAGHHHEGIAHVVNGIAITSSYSSARAFSRVDFTVDARTGELENRRVFPPHLLVPGATYEGHPVDADPALVAIAQQAATEARQLRDAPVGIHLETPFTLRGNPESALGNLFTDALLESLDVDIALHNVEGGLRRGLPAGELKFVDVYEMSPFENRIVLIDLGGADLRRVIAQQAHRGNRRVGFSGLRVNVACDNEVMSVRMELDGGDIIHDDDVIRIAINDYMATGGDAIFTLVMPAGGFPIDIKQALTRDIFVDWLERRGGSIHASEFLSNDNPKWTQPMPLDSECQL